jgi:hypothetical protein
MKTTLEIKETTEKKIREIASKLKDKQMSVVWWLMIISTLTLFDSITSTLVKNILKKHRTKHKESRYSMTLLLIAPQAIVLV